MAKGNLSLGVYQQDLAITKHRADLDGSRRKDAGIVPGKQQTDVRERRAPDILWICCRGEPGVDRRKVVTAEGLGCVPCGSAVVFLPEGGLCEQTIGGRFCQQDRTSRASTGQVGSCGREIGDDGVVYIRYGASAYSR